MITMSSSYFGVWLLIAAVLLPLIVGSVFVFSSGLIGQKWLNRIGLITSWVVLIFGVILWRFYNNSSGGYDFLLRLPSSKVLGSALGFGLNGLSLTMLLLTGVVGMAAASSIAKMNIGQKSLLWGLFLLALGGTVGAFACPLKTLPYWSLYCPAPKRVQTLAGFC
jgi:NADH-quinone oxidoreductase subunit M